jgi:streptogramin lyase
MNAAATVGNLVDLATGTALAKTPAGNGLAPQVALDTIANALVGCVNSEGAGSAACSTLFSATTVNGASPATTIEAVLNMARKPGANVPAVYGLATAAAVFQPMPATTPNDLTLSITYGAPTLKGPYFPAVDAAGNVWVPNFLNATLTELGPGGQVLSGSSGFTGGGLNEPYAVAIDAAGDPWVTNFGPVGASTVTKFLANGTPAAGAYACGAACYFPAFDAAGNLWVTGTTRATVLSPAGAVLKTFATNNGDSGVAVDGSGNAWLIGGPGSLMRLGLPAVQVAFPEGVTSLDGDELTTVALDAAGNAWYGSSRNNALGESSSTGAPISPPGGFTGGGLKGPAGIAVDGSGRVWVANRDGNTLSEFGTDGTAVSPDGGYQAEYLSNPRGVVVDPSGNVWITNFTGNSVTEFVGIATPTATPASPGNHAALP